MRFPYRIKSRHPNENATLIISLDGNTQLEAKSGNNPRNKEAQPATLLVYTLINKPSSIFIIKNRSIKLLFYMRA